MYDYQLAGKTDRVVFRGDASAVIGWLREYVDGPVDLAEADAAGAGA